MNDGVKKSISYTILFTIAILTVIPFFYKAVYAPITSILNLTEEEDQRRGGDFWSAFPGPFVDKYNSELRNKTIAEEWDNDPLLGDIYYGKWGYGPIQHLITLPLTKLKSIKLVSIVWLVFNYIVLATALLLILKIFKDLPILPKLIIVFLWMGYWPLYIAIQEDVIEIFEFFMIILSLHLLYKKRDIFSGISMGIASMTKFLPLIFLIYFLVKKKNKAFFAMLMTVLIIVIGTQITLGWQNSRTIKEFLKESTKNKSVYTYWRSQTLPSAIERIFSTTDYSYNQILYPQITRPWFIKWFVIRLVVMLIFFYSFILLYRKRSSKNLSIEYSLVSVVMLLISPHGQPYYLIFCLIGYSVAVSFIYKKKYGFGAALLGISYILSGYITQINLFDLILISEHYVNRHTFFYFLSFPAYGAILLFVLLIVIYHLNSYSEH